jgi:acyl-coenzyme A thioesterase PaaI-like protein
VSSARGPRIPPHHDPACFGCGDNQIGFRLPLPESEGVEHYEATFAFDERHQGGPGIVHGGLVSALLDEACGLLATWHRFPSVTGRIFVRYRRPVPIKRTLEVRARVEDSPGRRVRVRGELVDEGEILAEARAAFVHVPLEHFLATPEGRAAGEVWRRRLERAENGP